ncbi:MAG: PepSY domain-containing protein [Xanthobacteraceae bacterium]
MTPMRALILLHRWLGVAFCLLFAMWFASGIVMHFVPYPAQTEAERFAGLAPLDRAGVAHGPAEAVRASRIAAAMRVRLLQRTDGPIYVVSGGSTTKALRAADLADAAIVSRHLALAIATDYGRRRGLAVSNAQVVALARHDQWTFPTAYDAERPLYRIALNDGAHTELYVSSATGEVVLQTNGRQRLWNYLGSIPHWIYPTALRSRPAAWGRLVWWLSLLALIGATAGAAVGVARIEIKRWRPRSPYRGWQAWHHWLGLCCLLFVWSWIFSGWLSMDDGLLFSTGRATRAETAAIAGAPDWSALSHDELRNVSEGAREVEWFALGGQIYRRQRYGPNRQSLARAGSRTARAADERSTLEPAELNAVASQLGKACRPAIAIAGGDDYAAASGRSDRRVFRLICGGDWFDIDASNGALFQKLDSSRRVYRWLYEALHTFDVPALNSRPALRTTLIVGLCGCGFVFSLTGVVIGWRRLRSCLQSSE